MNTATSASLLAGLHDRGNETVWSAFSARYTPLLIAFGRKLGLSEHQAQDTAQDTLLAFATSYRQGNYHPSRGRLRTWLLGIATNKIRDLQRRRARELALGGQNSDTGLLEEIPDQETISQAWEEEWQRSVLSACIAEVRRHVEEKTIRAFELFAIGGWPADRVAEHLGLSRQAVYLAKARVLDRLKEIQTQMEEIW